MFAMTALKVFTVLSLFTFCNVSFCILELQQQTLRMVVTIFRHGDRAPDLAELYPKDPYINSTFYPYGLGELTNLGKRRLYRLGQTFRKMYDRLLGPVYLPGLIEPLTTTFRRAECSLQLFLAGLFPPYDTLLEWNSALNWNPIPYTKVALEDNGILSFAIVNCPKYQQLYHAYRKTPKATAVEEFYKPLYPYISENTGLNVTSPFDLFYLYFGFNTKREWGLKLPNWTKLVYPDYLRSLIENNHLFLTATPQLRHLFGGKLLKKTINDMDRIIKRVANQPKIYIYSAHESTVVSLMASLNVFYPHIPKYGSALIVELHKVNQKYYVKVRYNKDVDDKFVDLKIPGCDTMCLFEHFKSLVKENIPGDDVSCKLK